MTGVKSFELITAIRIDAGINHGCLCKQLTMC